MCRLFTAFILLVVSHAFVALGDPPQPKPTDEMASNTIRSAFERLSPAAQNRLRQRAKDLYELPDGTILDAYRYNRIIELANVQTWDKINRKQSELLGMGHEANDDRLRGQQFGPSAPLDDAEYEGMPSVVEIIADPSDTKSRSVFVAMFPEVERRHIGVYFPDREYHRSDLSITVERILDDSTVVAHVSFGRGMQKPKFVRSDTAYIRGCKEDTVLGQRVLGTFLLTDEGVEEPKSGERLQVFRVNWLDQPMEAERCAELIEQGTLPVVEWSKSAQRRNGKAVVIWKARPMRFQFN